MRAAANGSEPLDLLITGGHILDPSTNTDFVGSIGVCDGRIVDLTQGQVSRRAKYTIDAAGCFIFPGLIDYHAHFFEPFTELGVIPDVCFLPMGVTSAVDGGSAGAANFRAFFQTVISRSHVRTKAFINAVSAGMATLSYYENIDAAKFNERKLRRLFRDYPDSLLGLKVRIQKEMLGRYGIEALDRTLEIADAVGTRVCVHSTNPVVPAQAVANALRGGDIFCHIYHGSGSTLLGDGGAVKPEFWAARRRGVLFDAANGKMNWSLSVARAAIAQGFLPDIISTDLTTMSMYTHPVKGLPYVMSKYLNLGVSLSDILTRVTTVPAALMGMSGQIGTLAPGANADISIFRLLEKPIRFYDTFGEALDGNLVLIPQMTVLDGTVVYAQVDFEN